MPHGHRRAVVACALTQNYLQWIKARRRRAQRRSQQMRETRRLIAEMDAAQRMREMLDDMTDWSSVSGLSSSAGSLSDSTGASDADVEMGDDSDWTDCTSLDSDDDASMLSTDSEQELAMPELLPYDSDDDDDGWETDDDSDSPASNPLRTAVQDEINRMYSSRYQMPRTRLPRPAESFLHHTLLTLKTERPDHFRQQLRVSPLTFDRLVAAIEQDIIFQNDSDNAQQAAVEEQVAVALYRFGHDGNGASLQEIANWGGIGKGTVHLWTKRVMTAVLRKEFMDKAVHYPTEDEKEQAKEWVGNHSCNAWRDGWCFVDGTLVPLALRPFWFGESYFDRKCRYSLNVQIINLPNLRIIDFSYGHTGSTHDASAWEGTQMAQEHETVMDEGEWIWADSAYPVRDWIVAPYKKPERYEPDNDIFNNHVSQLRIRSEHAIGFLKGRFHSLKNLRVVIRNARTHRLATYWVASCIGIHSFAMDCEAEERGVEDDNDAFTDDPFLAEGLRDEDESDANDNQNIGSQPQRESARRLKRGREKREQLKRRLLRHKERVRQRLS